MESKVRLKRLLNKFDAESQASIMALLDGKSDGCCIRKELMQQPSSIMPEERSVERYVSTRDIDRDSEILVPGGAILDEYRRNPIVIFGHDYSMPPHARAASIEADEYGIKSTTVYATTPRGEEMWQLVSGGFLRGASVGFMPVESVANGGPGWSSVTSKLSKQWAVPPEYFAPVKAIYTKWLLLEYSDVNVPSDPWALTKQAKVLGLSESVLNMLKLPEPEDIVEVVPGANEYEPQTRLYVPGCNVLPCVRAIPQAHALPQVTIAALVEESLARLQGRV